MAKYSKRAGEKVEQVMHERKRGTLKSGSGKKVTSRKQAIAIGLSEAREEGARVPKKSASGRGGTKAAAKKGAAKKSPAKKKRLQKNLLQKNQPQGKRQPKKAHAPQAVHRAADVKPQVAVVQEVQDAVPNQQAAGSRLLKQPAGVAESQGPGPANKEMVTGPKGLFFFIPALSGSSSSPVPPK